jgi:MerR family gold-responsive transcriptional activator of gol and ges genes
LEGQDELEAPKAMRIGEASRLSGVSAKLIRYYESAGLLSPAGRDANGYRNFDGRNVHELRFIKRARALGFPIKQIVELLRLWRDTKRSSRKVRALAESHRQTVVSRMESHREIIEVLTRLVNSCRGDDRPECPILEEFGARKIHR